MTLMAYHVFLILWFAINLTQAHDKSIIKNNNKCVRCKDIFQIFNAGFELQNKI